MRSDHANIPERPAPATPDPWARIEIETDELGDTITRGVDDTGEFVVLEVLDADVGQ